MFEQTKEKPDRKLLYHYTTFGSLEKILINKTIRMYHSRHMNDALEGVWILKIIQETIKEHNPERVAILNQLYEDIQIQPSFLFCLSEMNNLLSLWTRYSNDGSGVAIAFDVSKYTIPTEIPRQSIHKYNSMGLFPCTYDTSEQKRKVQAAFASVKETDDESYRHLVDYSLSFKNEGFSEEVEWRVGNRVFEGHESGQAFHEIEQVRTEIRNDEILQYVDVRFETLFGSDFPICGLTIGPKSKVHHNDLIRHLDAIGIRENIDIIYSGIPYKGAK